MARGQILVEGQLRPLADTQSTSKPSRIDGNIEMVDSSLSDHQNRILESQDMAFIGQEKPAKNRDLLNFE